MLNNASALSLNSDDCRASAIQSVAVAKEWRKQEQEGNKTVGVVKSHYMAGCIDIRVNMLTLISMMGVTMVGGCGLKYNTFAVL